MNQQIRQAIKNRLKQQGLTQETLGNLTGMSQPNVARALAGRSGSVPDTWKRILEALDLELVAVPKGTDLDALNEKGS